MPPRIRITQRDIAREAGVSHVTVSLALRDHHSISEATRTRIKQIAERIGYVPDPMLSGLSSYRRSRRPAAYQSNIAWINTHKNPKDLYMGEYSEYYAGAKQQCKELGYLLEEVCLSDFQNDVNALASALRSRGITGLILAPCEHTGGELAMDFSDFSAVRLGYSFQYPLLNTITNAQYRTAFIATNHLVSLGYQRIALIVKQEVNKRTSGNFVGGFNASSLQIPKNRQIPPLSIAGWEDTKIARWIEKNQVDCILGQGRWLFPLLEKTGVRIPEDLGYADLALSFKEEVISGMFQNSFMTGIATVNMVNGMMQRGETGIPETPRHLYIEGKWSDGKTVRNLI